MKYHNKAVSNVLKHTRQDAAHLAGHLAHSRDSANGSWHHSRVCESLPSHSEPREVSPKPLLSASATFYLVSRPKSLPGQFSGQQGLLSEPPAGLDWCLLNE